MSSAFASNLRTPGHLGILQERGQGQGMGLGPEEGSLKMQEMSSQTSGGG